MDCNSLLFWWLSTWKQTLCSGPGLIIMGSVIVITAASLLYRIQSIRLYVGYLIQRFSDIPWALAADVRSSRAEDASRLVHHLQQECDERLQILGHDPQMIGHNRREMVRQNFVRYDSWQALTTPRDWVRPIDLLPKFLRLECIQFVRERSQSDEYANGQGDGDVDDDGCGNGRVDGRAGWCGWYTGTDCVGSEISALRVISSVPLPIDIMELWFIWSSCRCLTEPLRSRLETRSPDPIQSVYSIKSSLRRIKLDKLMWNAELKPLVDVIAEYSEEICYDFPFSVQCWCRKDTNIRFIGFQLVFVTEHDNAVETIDIPFTVEQTLRNVESSGLVLVICYTSPSQFQFQLI
jgi:hypothetical protein